MADLKEDTKAVEQLILIDRKEHEIVDPSLEVVLKFFEEFLHVFLEFCTRIAADLRGPRRHRSVSTGFPASSFKFITSLNSLRRTSKYWHPVSEIPLSFASPSFTCRTRSFSDESSGPMSSPRSRGRRLLHLHRHRNFLLEQISCDRGQNRTGFQRV